MKKITVELELHTIHTLHILAEMKGKTVGEIIDIAVDKAVNEIKGNK